MPRISAMISIKTPSRKSQTFARQICKTAWNWGLQPEALSASCLEHLADYVTEKFPHLCDARFRKQAIARVKLLQAYHAGRPRPE